MLCSRLCHDMLSPVGAIANGLELLNTEDNPEMRATVMELLEQSSRISSQKLIFFRLAFGAAGGYGEMIAIDQAKGVLNALVADSKGVTCNWAIEEAKLPKSAIKVLLNLAHIGLESLIRGGTLDVGAETRDGNIEIVVRASAERVAFDEVIGRALQDELEADELNSRTAAAYMTFLVAQEAGGGLQYKYDKTSLVMGAVIPEPEGVIR